MFSHLVNIFVVSEYKLFGPALPIVTASVRLLAAFSWLN